MSGLVYDSEYSKAVEPFLAIPQPPAPVDALELRKLTTAIQSGFMPQRKAGDGIHETNFDVQSFDGAQIQLRRFATQEHISASTPQPAILAVHGGGLVAGDVDGVAGFYAQDALDGDRPVFAVGYRLAPEHRAPTAVEDAFHALKYLIQNAAALNIDPARIALKGESSGGGIAAGLALLARDRGVSPPPAKQILLCPMLDDRTDYAPETKFLSLTTWSLQRNKLGWAAYLGEDKAGKPDASVSEYAAPARAQSLAGVAPAYIDVGTLDLFRDEAMGFAQRLMRDNVEVEFHLWPGVPHAFEVVAIGSKWQVRASEARIAALRSF